MAKVKLNDILDGIEASSGENFAILSRQTGEVEILTEDIMAYEDDAEQDIPEWARDSVKIAIDYEKNPDAYLLLPEQYDVDEYRMMKNFAYSLTDENHTDKLLTCISGKGAFRLFKIMVQELGIADSWYAYRDEQYKQFAKQWCEDNELPYA